MNLKLKHLVYLFFTVVVLAIFNWFCRKHLNGAYSVPLNFQQLYYSNEQPHIIDVGTENDSLNIQFAGIDQPQWQSANFFFSSEIQKSREEFSIKIKPSFPGKHILLMVSGDDSSTFFIDYSPSDVYRKNNNSSAGNYELISPDIPLLPGPLYSVSAWRRTFWPNIKPEEYPSSYLKNSIGILETDSSFIKVLKIGKFILDRTKGRVGIPADFMNGLSPLEQLNAASSGQSALWCTNLDLIFSYLANGAGLATRHISTGLSEGDFSTGNHCFSEVYLPELKQWAYVDLTAATIFIKLKNKFLNVVEVAQLNRMGLDKSDLHAIACINGEIDTVPFTGSISALAEYYFYPGVSFTFYFSEYLRKKDSPDILTRGIKFFNTKPYYAIFSEGGCQTFNFVLFVRVASGYLLASVSLLLIIISIVYFLKSNNRRC